MRFRLCAIAVLTLGVPVLPVAAADLEPRTVAAFDRYVRVAEGQMTPDPFLRVDALPEAQRREKLAALRGGELYIERLRTREADKSIEIPGGLIHHWLGAVFVPDARLDQALSLMQDYDRHAEIFRPAIARSKLVSREGDVFRVDLRFYMKKVITVVVNTENEARFSRPGRDRAQSRIYSLRVVEVENPGTPQEHEKPVGHDGGYLWRLYTYWRFLERDNGTYVQCEAISLTRSIPFALGWLIGPFVTSIPRESLEFTLETIRKTLLSHWPEHQTRASEPGSDQGLRVDDPNAAAAVAGSITSVTTSIATAMVTNSIANSGCAVLMVTAPMMSVAANPPSHQRVHARLRGNWVCRSAGA